MDDTTKTIIGMISAFIIAFLAEPIKTYFQNRAQANKLRIALYKELLFDYRAVEGWLISEPRMRETSSMKKAFKVYREYAIRTECYEEALSADLPTFYQLAEASDINYLHLDLSLVTKLPFIGSKPFTKRDRTALRKHSVDFLRSMERSIHDGRLDQQLVEEVELKENFISIMRRVKDYPRSGFRLPDTTEPQLKE